MPATLEYKVKRERPKKYGTVLSWVEIENNISGYSCLWGGLNAMR
jgi:hypothetical protein